MIVNLNASVDSPIYFELNEADEVVIVGDKKDELQRRYIGKKSSCREINHPQRPQLCVDDCKDWHIIVTFRDSQEILVHGLVANVNQDVVVHGLVAEVIKKCLKKGCPFDYKDENLHFVDEQIQMQSKINKLERCVNALIQMRGKISKLERSVNDLTQKQGKISGLERRVNDFSLALRKISALESSVTGLSRMQSQVNNFDRIISVHNFSSDGDEGPYID